MFLAPTAMRAPRMVSPITITKAAVAAVWGVNQALTAFILCPLWRGPL
jgi:hypothetical protein